MEGERLGGVLHLDEADPSSGRSLCTLLSRSGSGIGKSRSDRGRLHFHWREPGFLQCLQDKDHYEYPRSRLCADIFNMTMFSYESVWLPGRFPSGSQVMQSGDRSFSWLPADKNKLPRAAASHSTRQTASPASLPGALFHLQSGNIC